MSALSTRILKQEIKVLRERLYNAECELVSAATREETSARPLSLVHNQDDERLATMILAHELGKNWANWNSYLGA